MFLKIFLLKILVGIICISQTDGRETFWATLIKLKKSLEPGDSLKGKTVKSLQTGKYSVEVSGAVENYMKWPLTLLTAERSRGVITYKLPNVKVGVMEGFASHKTLSTATGTAARYSLLMDDDIIIHFMYSAQYFNRHPNILSVALCPRTNTMCRSLDAEKMYHGSYPFMKRKQFYDDTNPVGICHDETCLMGWMTTDHHPTMYLLVFPKSYYHLGENIRKRMPDMSAQDYAWFVKRAQEFMSAD